jgi:hypothetical protein
VPKPNITWYKDTSKIDGGLPGYSVDEVGSLTVHFLRAQDSGMYQCWASNSAGEANGYSWLRVKSKSEFVLALLLCLCGIFVLTGRDSLMKFRQVKAFLQSKIEIYEDNQSVVQLLVHNSTLSSCISSGKSVVQ